MRVVRRARRQPVIWCWLGGLGVGGLALHLFYHVKTKRWTRPWGSRDDLAAVPER